MSNFATVSQSNWSHINSDSLVDSTGQRTTPGRHTVGDLRTRNHGHSSNTGPRRQHHRPTGSGEGQTNHSQPPQEESKPVVSNPGGRLWTTEEMLAVYHSTTADGPSIPPFDSSEMYASNEPKIPMVVRNEPLHPPTPPPVDMSDDCAPAVAEDARAELYQETAESLALHDSFAATPLPNIGTGTSVFGAPVSAAPGSLSASAFATRERSRLYGDLYRSTLTPSPSHGTRGTPEPTLPPSSIFDSWTRPPGLQRTIPSESIQWVYTDPQGALQGPFAGSAMHSWYISGWLNDDLWLRRTQDQEFITLGELKQRVQNPQPFAANMTAEAWDAVLGYQPQQQQRSISGSALGWGRVPSQPSAIVNNGWQAPAEPLAAVGSGAPSRATSEPAKDLEEAEVDESQFSGMLQELEIDDKDTETELEPSVTVPESDFNTDSISVSVALEDSDPWAQPEELIAEPAVVAPTSVLDDTLASTGGAPAATASASAPEPAPWVKAATPAAPRVSLKELKEQQEREAEKKKQQATLNAQKARAAAAAAAAAAVSVAPVPVHPVPSNDVSNPGWATPTVAAPRRSIAQLQREQAEAAAAKQAQKAAAASAAPIWGAGPADNVKAVRPSAPVTESTSPWQTINRKVAAKPAAPGAPVTAVPAANTAAAPVASSVAPTGAPGIRRPVQQPTAPAAPAAAAILKPASPVDELIIWTKSTLKQAVAKDVNLDELLELIFSLPVNSDSKEFIAESLYEYSTTLDGRRFAHEFMQRRRLTDGLLKSGDSWKDVLQRSNPDLELDPSFKVVTKKRYRQLARPNGL